MAITDIKAFADKARSEPDLGSKLKECQKVKELRALAAEQGFTIVEDELYPPNTPQFTEEQLSARLVKALLRA